MNPVLFPTDLPADAGNRLLAYDNELEQRRIRNRLLDYGEASLDGLSRMGRAIDPMRFVSERDVVGFLPGAGMVEGYEQMGTARDKFREGDYLGAAGDYALGAFNSVTDVIPAMAVLPPVRTGIRAYHGSPHDFDRFSLEYIGTGEGAQAFGHGLYFGENESTARMYRDALTDQPAYDAARRAVERAGSPDSVAEELRWRLDGMDSTSPDAVRLKGVLGMIESGRFAGTPPGRMYEVRINADPDAFLDWDKPIPEQSSQVLAALGYKSDPEIARLQQQADDLLARGALQNDLPPGADDLDLLFGGNYVNPALAEEYMRVSSELDAARMRGQPRVEQTVRDLVKPNTGFDSSRAAIDAAARLRASGIPGVRYLDAGSRGVRDGTRNYVVFDDSLIEILRKYGVGGLAALPAGVLAGMGLTREQAEDLDANRAM